MVGAVCDCLVPVAPGVDAGGEVFEVWGTFKEGTTRYLTFGTWLEKMITTLWVARDDPLVRSLLPDLPGQVAAIDRCAADPGWHWYAVRLVRRLAAAPPDDQRVAPALDRLWDGMIPICALPPPRRTWVTGATGPRSDWPSWPAVFRTAAGSRPWRWRRRRRCGSATTRPYAQTAELGGPSRWSRLRSAGRRRRPGPTRPLPFPRR
jgi:hypothetical protein